MENAVQHLLAKLAPTIAGKITGIVAEPNLPSEEYNKNPEVKKLWDLYAAMYEIEMYRSPIMATMRSDYRYNDSLGDNSEETVAEKIEEYSRILAELESINADRLPASELQNHRFLKDVLDIELVSLKLPSANEIALSHMFNMFTFLVQLPQFHPLKTKEDAETFIKRMEAVPEMADQTINWLRQGIKKNYTLPGFSVDHLINQMEAMIAPVADFPLYKLAQPKFAEVGYSDEKLQKVLSDSVLTAYEKVKSFLQEEYLPHARKVDGISGFENAEEIYNGKLLSSTTLSYTASQIHQMGLDEVARIRSEMLEVKNSLGFNGSLKDFMDWIKTDKQFTPSSSEFIVEEYTRILKIADEKVKPFFGLLPKAPYEVRAVEPYKEKSAPPAFYFPPAQDGSRPGIFYANTYLYETRNTYVMESIALHEAIPGHHFQIALAQELTNLPRVRLAGRRCTTSYAEGWGLYTEKLGLELGFYTDPYQNFGRLVTEMMRAVRLVVDTGIHSLGWNREKALEYFIENSAMPEVDAKNEIDRYCVMPGQAVSYKVGEIKIWELRRRAEQKLGNKFNLSDFHDLLLGSGSVTLPLLEAAADDWIAARA